MRKIIFFITCFSFSILFSIGSFAKFKTNRSKNRYFNKNKNIIELKVRRIRNRNISIKKNTIHYDPKSGGRRAHFISYVFKKKNFRRKIGSIRFFRNKKIRIKVIKRVRKNLGCPPGSQCPQGGFTKTYIYARILSVHGLESFKREKTRVVKMNKVMNLKIIKNRYNEFRRVGKYLHYTINASGRRTAFFKTYVFKYKSFIEKVGDIKSIKNKTIRIRIFKRVIKQIPCIDKRLNCPHGGFRYIYFHSTIL